MTDSLRRSIIKTLAYFDIFSYPLTREELAHFLWSDDHDSVELPEDLDDAVWQGLPVRRQGGYIALQDGQASVADRNRRLWYVEPKMEIAQRAIQKLRWVPFVRAVFVCNQLPVTAKRESDIDVFIIVGQGRLWLTRLLITGVLTLLQLRRHGPRVTDHLCLSFYCTDDALDLQSIALDEPDIYLVYWIASLIPIFDPSLYRREIWERNEWVRRYLPRLHLGYAKNHRWQVSDSRVSHSLRWFAERVLGGGVGTTFERWSKKVQQVKMKRGRRSQEIRPNTHVIISDSMLKFHENDRRAFYREEWRRRCAPYL